jgi:hypothetical protein
MLLPFLVDALSKDALIPIQKLTLFIEGDLKAMHRCLQEGDLMSMTRAGQTYVSLDVLREILQMVGRTDVLDSVDFIARHFDMYSKGDMDGFYLNAALQGGLDKRYNQVVTSLSKRVNGATNVPCKGGIADIITETDIIQLANGRDWRKSLQRLTKLVGHFPSHTPILHVVETCGRSNECGDRIRSHCKQAGVYVRFEVVSICLKHVSVMDYLEACIKGL